MRACSTVGSAHGPMLIIAARPEMNCSITFPLPQLRTSREADPLLTSSSHTRSAAAAFGLERSSRLPPLLHSIGDQWNVASSVLRAGNAIPNTGGLVSFAASSISSAHVSGGRATPASRSIFVL